MHSWELHCFCKNNAVIKTALGLHTPCSYHNCILFAKTFFIIITALFLQQQSCSYPTLPTYLPTYPNGEILVGMYTDTLRVSRWGVYTRRWAILGGDVHIPTKNSPFGEYLLFVKIRETYAPWTHCAPQRRAVILSTDWGPTMLAWKEGGTSMLA